MKEKNIIWQLFVFCAIFFGLTFVSCEDYLDKAPEAGVIEIDAYGNFRSFQGFVEELHNCVPNYSQRLGGNWYMSFNVTDELLASVPHFWDDGNYWDQKHIYARNNLNLGENVMNKFIWQLGWYAIRKTNLGLENLDLLTDASPEEKNVIKGQLLYWRAWFHFELMRFWGGLPYIDELLSPSEVFAFPRLTYKEAAMKVAADFEEAASLLPLNWDNESYGQLTLGNNEERPNKIKALSFLGKNLLYAASPMMNESSTGVNEYDSELCIWAAKVFAEIIRTCNETGRYQLQPWDSYTNNFWMWTSGRRDRPGGTEVIMNPTIYEVSYARWTTCRTGTPRQFNAGGNIVEVPTHNYTKNYHMANGLPIDDPASGYDPNDPWNNREPRYYLDFINDGTPMTITSTGGAANDHIAQLHNTGRHRHGSVNANEVGSVTGYLYWKWNPIGCNQWDARWDNFQALHPYIRLADIYLMYAEAVLHGYGSSASVAEGGTFTAAQAVNVIRNRAQLPDLTPAYTDTKDVFMKAIIRERAVELSFEDHRWFDLRRWNIAGNPEYLQKTGLRYDRGPDGKPVNVEEFVITTRVFEKKHNWVPFQPEFTMIHEGFPQNPGW